MVLVGVVARNRVDAARGQVAKESPIDPTAAAFTALVATPLLMFLVAFRSDLGVARDWDLLVPCGLAGLALLRPGLARVPAGVITDRHTASLVILCATMTCAWIGINASGERSVARYRAILSYDNAQFLDPGYAYELLASYHRDREDVRGEIDALEHAVGVSDNPRYRLTLGMRYYSVGDKERAIEMVERSLRSTPNDGRTRQTLVQMLYFAGRMEELERVCDEGIRLEPSQPLYYFLKGKALAAAGRNQEALDVLRRARELNPTGRMASDIDEMIRSLRPAP
jgi:tetratricopeptide (TPR) repeat protein